MASSAKDIQLRELKDTISQLNTIMSEQTELIRSLRTIIEEKTAHEKMCIRDRQGPQQVMEMKQAKMQVS